MHLKEVYLGTTSCLGLPNTQHVKSRVPGLEQGLRPNRLVGKAKAQAGVLVHGHPHG